MKTTIPAALLRAAPVAVLLFSSSALQAAAPPTPQGIITAKEFLNIGGGTAVADLTSNPKFPDSPDVVNYPILFEWPANDDGSQPGGSYLDAYGTQIIGYFYPTVTGPHTFYICSDDNSALYLSTDESPANKHLIAMETAWSTVRQYDASAGGSDLTAKRSDQFKQSTWPTTTNINLVAGKAYYIEALSKEGGGGDNLSVSIDAVDPIPGAQLSSFDRASVTAPYARGLTGSGAGFYFQIQEVAGGSQVNQTSIQLTFDSSSVTPRVTKVGNVVVVAYQTPAVLAIGTSHSATLTFTDNATSPLTQTVTRGFAVGPYATIPPSYAIPTPPTDPGMKVQVYQIDFVRDPGDENSIPDVEQQWARGFIDPNTGQPYPNVANATAQAGPINVNFINWNGAMDPAWPDTDAGQEIGDFRSTNDPPMNVLDVAIPGIPGSGSDPRTGGWSGWAVDNLVAEVEAYLKLDPGFYRMGVNSDDGFKVTVAPGAPNPFGLVLGSFNGGRGADTTLFDFVVTSSGYYPFRLLWWQGGGGANLEWFVQDLNTGLKYLVNQNDPKAVKAFRTGRGRAYVQSLVPADGYTGAATNQTVKIVLGNDLTTVVDGSIALRLDGATVTPTINKSGTTTTVTYKEPSGYAFGSDHKGTLIWSEGTTPQTTWTNNFSFSVMLETPDDLPANSFWIEAEDFDSTGTPVPASLSTMPYDVGVSMPYDGIGATSGVDYSNNDSHENTNPTTYRSAGDPDTDGRSVDLTTTNGRYATRRPGGFDMTADYRIGWVDDGEWYNYTRNVAPGIYTAVAALSHGDARGTPHDLRGKLSIVTSGVGTTTQTLKDVGTFDAPSSGAWGDNDLVPMKAADGSEAVFKLAGAGPTTLRFTTGSGDYDWFALVPRNSVAPVLTSLTPPTDLTVYRDSKFTWTIEDFSTAVQAGSITLRFADADVTSQLAIAKPTSDTTTVSYQPAQLLDFGKPYSYELAFKDNGNPPKTKTITGTIVAHYLPNPPAGCFAIEAEDFNYNSGQTRPGINQMPYFGGAYDTLSAVAGIDYQRSSTVPDGDVYRLTETPNVPMGAALGTTQERPGTVPDVNRAGWDMTANFSLGWAGSGNWENYTRDIPTNIYQFWAAMSYDGRSADQLTGNLLKVTAGATTAQQTTELLGTFRAPGTGGWGANSLVPMRDPNTQQIAAVPLSGVNTFRFENVSGDFDYLMLVPTLTSSAAVPQFSQPVLSGNTVIISWTGPGTLQEASTLTGNASDWSNVANPANPYTVSIGSAPRKFYRVKAQ